MELDQSEPPFLFYQVVRRQCFPPNSPVLVFPCLYRHRTHRHAYLLTSSSADLTTIHIFLLSQLSRLSIASLLISTASPPIVIPCVSARHDPLSLLSPSSFYSRSWKSFALTGQGRCCPSLKYLFIAFSLLSVATASLCCLWCDCVFVPLGWVTIYKPLYLLWYVPCPIVQPDIHHHLSVIPSYIPPFAVLRRPSLPCISNCRHRLHCPGISSAHCYFFRCLPLDRVCVYLSSATTTILVEPLAFSLLPRYLSFCSSRPPPSYLRHPGIYASLRFALPPQYVMPTTLPTSSLSISPLSISNYLSIYIYPLTHFLSPLSHSLSVPLYFIPTS